MSSRGQKTNWTNLQNRSLIDSAWLSKAKQAPHNSWAYEVLTNLIGPGGTYLNTLRTWFARFPKNSAEIANQLESLATPDHLGAVNEIFWWEWMKRFNWTAEPVIGRKSKRPDFHISIPSDFYCEVTTQNISAEVEENLSSRHAIDLNDERTRTIERLLIKARDEKLTQIQFGATRQKPTALVLFDYTFWSNFGVPFQELAKYLGPLQGFRKLPSELSAIIYVERKVINGRLALSQLRSAVHHNPYAQFRIPETVFPMLVQYNSKFADIKPVQSLQEQDGWIWVD